MRVVELCAVVVCSAGAGCGRFGFEPAGRGDASDDGGGVLDSDATTPSCLASDLVLHLRLDETAGNTASDSSGAGNTGALLGFAALPPWVPGRHGNALRFDGVNDRIDVGSASVLDDLTTFSICIWANPDGFPGAFPILADKSLDGYNDGWNFYLTSTGMLGMFTNYAASVEGGAIAQGAWQHLCATWDGTQGISRVAIFRNGAPLQAANSTPGGGTFTSDSAHPLVIGRMGNAAEAFFGLLDDVRVYRRALADAEIAALYTCTP